MPKQTPDHSPMGGAGVLIGTTFALLLGQSLGDFLLVDLDETVGVWSIGLELRLGPAPTAGAGYEGSVEVCVLWQAAGYPASVVLKFDKLKVFAGSLENATNVSEERANTTAKYMTKQLKLQEQKDKSLLHDIPLIWQMRFVGSVSCSKTFWHVNGRSHGSNHQSYNQWLSSSATWATAIQDVWEHLNDTNISTLILKDLYLWKASLYIIKSKISIKHSDHKLSTQGPDLAHETVS